MPELPEVETIKKGLTRYLIGHKITDVKIHSTKVFQADPSHIKGAIIKGIRRFAKVLSIDLSNSYSIVIHIKMTGQLIYRGPHLPHPPPLSTKVKGLPGKHTHVIFHLDNSGILYYNDVRKFGWIRSMKTNTVAASNFIGKLGPEPFGELTAQRFKEIIGKYKTPIKPLLMDQNKIAGVGNIYANDACFLAKIHPKRPANSLNKKEQDALYKSLLQVLKEGLKRGGASENTFVTSEGHEGGYQEHFLAYAQDGKQCTRCKKEKIIRIVLGGRGTFFCPRCQNLIEVDKKIIFR